MYQDLRPEYEPDWKGPVEKRSATDRPFLVAFSVLMVLWVGVGIYALSKGDLPARLAPVDKRERKCGIDDAVVDAPRLVYFDLGDENAGKVCRAECPTTDWHYMIDWDKQTVEEIREKLICLPEADLSGKTKSGLRDLIDMGACAKWYLKSSSIVGRCVPERIPKEFVDVTMTEDQLDNVRKSIILQIWGGPILVAAINTRGPALGLVVVAAILGLLYIFLLKWIAFPCALISAAFMFGFYCWLTYFFNKLYNETQDSTFMIYTIIFGVLAALTVIIVACLYKKMRLACELIKEASEAVTNMFASQMFPILPWLLQLAATVHFVVVALYIFAIEDLDNAVGGLLFTVHVTAFLWFYFFVEAFVEMTLAFTFATWYWTFNKLQLPSRTVLDGASKTFRYHLGTVAFGSLLITICRMIRILLYILRSSRSRGVCTLFLICIQFIIDYVEKFLKFMNRNAYIMCAVYGKGLCTSASNAMNLILRNALTAILLNNMVSWILFLGKFLIAVIGGLLAFWCHADKEYEEQRIHVVWMVAIGSYLVADIFCSVYVIAIDSIFLCFLEDRERNDGSAARPYYMSQRLRALLHKDVVAADATGSAAA